MKYYISFVVGLRPPSNTRVWVQVTSSSLQWQVRCCKHDLHLAAAPINHHNTRLNVMDFSNLGANKTN